MANTNEIITIGKFEAEMLKIFPAEQACQWDTTGLTIGDEQAIITKVAVALDPTIAAIRAAKNAGANLLLTHHPVVFTGDIARTSYYGFVPGNCAAGNQGVVVYEAISQGIACMNFHTTLDVSDIGTNMLPNLLDLRAGEVVSKNYGAALRPSAVGPASSATTGHEIKSEATKNQLGFGRVCTPASGKAITLKELAEKCKTALCNTCENRDGGDDVEATKRCKTELSSSPRIWGDDSTELTNIATNTGSSGKLSDPDSFASCCLKLGVDAIVTGEIGYHDALTLSEAGICIIELGHDVSELPLCTPLAEAAEKCGIAKEDLVILDQSENWHTV